MATETNTTNRPYKIALAAVAVIAAIEAASYLAFLWAGPGGHDMVNIAGLLAALATLWWMPTVPPPRFVALRWPSCCWSAPSPPAAVLICTDTKGI